MKNLYKNILIITFFVFIMNLLSARALNAQEEPAVNFPPFNVTLNINSQNFTLGDSFTLTLIIDYPIPDNVAVYAPQYDDFLSLDRLIIFPRLEEPRQPQTTLRSQMQAQPQEPPQVQTIAEYRFITTRVGRFTLEAFTVISPTGTKNTHPVTLEIIARNVPVTQTVTQNLVWEGARIVSGNAVLTAAAGDRVTLTLRSGSWRSLQPPPEFFMPQVPMGVILTPLPVTGEERDSGVIIKLRLIPLAQGEIIFPARTLTHENVRFVIPLLRINVSP